MSETATCVICGRTRPISKMRHGTFKVEVGSHTTTSSGSRRSNRHSNSFGGSSSPRIGNSYNTGYRTGRSTRHDYARIPGYACKSHGRFGRFIVVCLLIFAAYAYLTGKFAGHHSTRSSAGSQPAYQTDATDDHTSADRRSDGDTPPQSDGKATSPSETKRSADTQPALSDAKASMAAAFIADPASNPRIDAAMTEAANSGKPVRWHADKLHGYAVPGDPDASGCRMIQVSVDETGEQSAAVKRCP